MSTRKQALVELLKDHAEAKAKVNLEYDLREALPTEYRDRVKVHVHTLYGSVASVGLAHDFFDYTKTKLQPTLDDVLALAKLVPPVPTLRVNEGANSPNMFYAQQYLDGLPQEQRDRLDTQVPICPFVVDTDYNDGKPTAKIEWYGLLAGHLVRVEIVFSMASLPRLCTHSVQRARNNSGNLQRVDFSPCGDIHQLLNPNIGRVASIGSVITWGGCSLEYKKHTMYWEPDYIDDSEREATLDDLVRQLR